MQIITGTKREITLTEWAEALRMQVDNISNHLKCFEAHNDRDSVEWIMEDLPRLSETVKHTLQVIDYCNEHGIQ